jgi:hypothetical protein
MREARPTTVPPAPTPDQEAGTVVHFRFHDNREKYLLFVTTTNDTAPRAARGRPDDACRGRSAAVYVAQIEDGRMTEAIATTRYLDVMRARLRRHGGAWSTISCS